MPSLKDLKIRIKSVKSTQKITSAMKMVAAAKLRRAQEAAEAARPYAQRMERMIASLGGKVGRAGPKLIAGTGRDDVHMIVVATADRGLCGGFNTTIVRAARRRIIELEQAGKTVKIMTVGRKARDQLRRTHGGKIVKSLENIGRTTVGFETANDIARELIHGYDAGEFDVCTIFFNRFKSAMSQVVTAQQLIPASVPTAE